MRSSVDIQFSVCLIRIIPEPSFPSQGSQARGTRLLAHLPSTFKVAGSSFSKNFLDATQTQSSCEKNKSQRSAESRGFSPGTAVSYHRNSRQGGLGKKAHSTVIGICCCGDPALVSKVK